MFFSCWFPFRLWRLEPDAEVADDHFRYPFAFSQSATIFCTSDETGLESSFAAFSSATFTAGINRTLSGGYAWLGFGVGIETVLPSPVAEGAGERAAEHLAT
jgi:hypothetical protein